MERLYFQDYQAPCFTLRLGCWEEQICLCHFHKQDATIDRLQQQLSAPWSEQETPLLCDAKAQLDEYFEGKRTSFDLPLLTFGTDFERSVWEALTHIPYGQTRTYQQIAQSLQRPLAVRAVGNAIHKNALSILVPCHRVIGSNGQLTGYVGGLEVKQFLLNLETK